MTTKKRQKQTEGAKQRAEDEKQKAEAVQVEPGDRWAKPQNIDLGTMVFPANVCDKLLPPMRDIPEEFKKHTNPWCELVSKLFFSGGQLPAVKEGIDAKHAKRHLGAVLGSFEPKHEHKTAGAAYLMSLWYQSPQSPE